MSIVLILIIELQPMETTNFGFVASLLFVGVPTIFSLVYLFLLKMEKNQVSTLTLVKVDLDQNVNALINALHFCRGIFIRKSNFQKVVTNNLLKFYLIV